jgi:hypothetical protein
MQEDRRYFRSSGRFLEEGRYGGALPRRRYGVFDAAHGNGVDLPAGPAGPKVREEAVLEYLRAGGAVIGFGFPFLPCSLLNLARREHGTAVGKCKGRKMRGWMMDDGGRVWGGQTVLGIQHETKRRCGLKDKTRIARRARRMMQKEQRRLERLGTGNKTCGQVSPQ